MPGSIAGDLPSVSLSFANNFWGKDDAGVAPLLERMHNAKVCGEELRAFYTARTAIEDEYARKLLTLARKPLGSSEAGTLRMSLDVIRGEVESIAKAHQNIAAQLKSELDEPLGAFAGGMKERRKIVQGGIEKLLKTKTQQTMTVNKARDRYEQDCLKIKGYLAQGHMVMGQEERKNKAKLEKTQIQLSSTSNEYEAAVKILEETTGKWNRDWKAACDKFQDLEEERIDFMKNSLWTFANVASTVCVSDDASCEKIRLSLEQCDVEKDISTFIRECGTGQEIPDPPKYINFCRGDINDTASEISDDGSYSVAQFQRTMNPAFRSSSPQPATYPSQHDGQSPAVRDFGLAEPGSQSKNSIPRKSENASLPPIDSRVSSSQRQAHPGAQQEDFPKVPHNEYPLDGMTQFCRIGPPSELSSAASPVRPLSRDSQSECSNPTSFSSQDPSLGSQSPTKHMIGLDVANGHSSDAEKKRAGFFQNRSPFRKKSRGEKERPQLVTIIPPAVNRTAWAPSSRGNITSSNPSPTRQTLHYGQNGKDTVRPGDHPSPSPEPVDPRANFQLNVGNNVFDVASPDARNKLTRKPINAYDELDPIAQALAELKGVTKQSSVRVSADRYHGITSPAPGSARNRASNTPKATPRVDRNVDPAKRATPPPSYDQPPISRLGAPQPAFTSREMQRTTQQYVDQKQNMFSSPSRYISHDQQQSQLSTPQSRNGKHGGGSQAVSRGSSPTPYRSISPRPAQTAQYSDQRQTIPRATSPNPYFNPNALDTLRPRAHSTSPIKPGPDGYSSFSVRGGSPGHNIARAASPQPQFNNSQISRPASSAGNMTMQLAPAGGSHGYNGQPLQPLQRGRPVGLQSAGASVSQYGGSVGNGASGAPHDQRTRSKSSVGHGQFTKEGTPILHYARALYMYQAAIPEELSFAKGDVLAVLRLQDDGWWEAELAGKRGRPGLVPSNYLVNC